MFIHGVNFYSRHGRYSNTEDIILNLLGINLFLAILKTPFVLGILDTYLNSEQIFGVYFKLIYESYLRFYGFSS